MKKLVFVLIGSLMIVFGCSKAPTTGTVRGGIMLKAGISGDLGNTSVRLYSDASFTQMKYEEAIRGTNPYTFTFDSIDPGNYYLLCWKDLNGDNKMDWNDFIDWYTEDSVNWTPTPLTVLAGETTDIGIDTIPFSNLNTASYMFIQDSAWTDASTGDTLKLRTFSIFHGTIDSIEIWTPDVYHGDSTYIINANFESRQYHIWTFPSDSSWPTPSDEYLYIYYGTGTLANLTMPFEVLY